MTRIAGPLRHMLSLSRMRASLQNIDLSLTAIFGRNAIFQDFHIRLKSIRVAILLHVTPAVGSVSGHYVNLVVNIFIPR